MGIVALAARGVALPGAKVPGPSDPTGNFCDKRIINKLD